MEGAIDDALILQAPLMALPTLADLHPSADRDLRRLERAFAMGEPQRPVDREDDVLAQADRFRELAHRLSAISQERRPPPAPCQGRTKQERVLFDRLCASGIGALASGGSSLSAIVREVASQLGVGSVRVGDICSAPDREGYRVRFPPPRYIEDRLAELDDYIRTHGVRCAGLTATVTYCAIGNLHPLQDGNGRLSRILFNYLMQQPGRPRLYLPLYEISPATVDGLLIAAREAQFLGRWRSVMNIISQSALIYYDVKVSQ